MGPLICYLSAGLLVLAAGIAFRLAWTRRPRWGWALLGGALGLQALARVSAGLDQVGPASPEGLELGLALLFLGGLVAFQGRLHGNLRNTEIRGAVEAGDPAEPKPKADPCLETAVSLDITGVRAAEEDLQRVNAIQNLILEHNVLGLAYVQERRLVWSNPRAAEMFGIPVEQFIGAPARIIYPDDATYEEIGRKSYPLMGLGRVADTRVRMRRADGHHFWCRLVGMAVDPESPNAGSVWLAEDISQQVAAEEALKDSEARFRGAFEGTHDALLLLTPNGIFDCNLRAVELFGFDQKAEMLRMQPADFSPARQPGGEDSRTLAAKWLQAAVREGIAHFRWEYRRQNGETFPAEVLLSTFKMGRNRVVQACVRDIRDRLAAERIIHDSEARFHQFFERFADPLLVLDGRTSAILDFNQAALDTLRCTREEMSRLRVTDLFPEFQPDGRPSVAKGLEMIQVAFERGSHRFRWVHRSPHREEFVVEVLLTVVRLGADPLLIAAWRELPRD